MKYAFLLESKKNMVVAVEASSLEEALSLVNESPEDYMENNIDEETDTGHWEVAKPRNYCEYVDTTEDIIEYQKGLGYGYEIK